MQALLVSDLHFEFHRDKGRSLVNSLPDADILLCPGDLCDAAGLCDALLLLLGKWQHVVYTFGNHEFYGSGIPEVRRNVQDLAERLPSLGSWLGQLHLLDNSTCEIEGRRFVGTTLWFRKMEGLSLDESSLNDFYQIKRAHQEIYEENAKSEKFLRDTISENDLVLTHHLPSYASVHPRYLGSSLNRFFVCDVEELILERQPKMWVHGHTHDSCDYNLGKTRVLCNPFGYQQYDLNMKFNEHLIVEI